MVRRVLFGVLLACTIAIAIWWPRPDALPTAPEAANSPVATAPAALAPATTDGKDGAASTAAARDPERTAVTAEPTRLATIMGRCVLAAGAPRADCRVALTSWNDAQPADDTWLLEHPEALDWTAPAAITTQADGRFAFSFWPPTRWHFRLRIDGEGCVPSAVDWQHLDEGAHIDLGDVLLTPGVHVTGRVVDGEGLPIAPANVVLGYVLPGTAEGIPKRLWSVWCKVAEGGDGAFATAERVPAGTWPIEIRYLGFTVRTQPDHLDVGEDDPTICTLVVERPKPLLATAPDPTSICGQVVDDTGQPVRALVRDEDARVSNQTFTDREGHFELRRHPYSGSVAHLAVASERHEALPEPLVVAWGSRDVGVVLRRGADLTVRITDAQGRPIENYLARLAREDVSFYSSKERSARYRHPDGVTTISGFACGRWLLSVEFAASSGLAPLFAPLQQTTPGPRRVELVAQPLAQRRARVVTGDGPVAGAVVQLCEPFGEAMSAGRLVLGHDAWTSNPSTGSALVLSEATTGADGKVLLRGPGGRDLALQLPGPGHTPCGHANVRLDEPTELVVHVVRGARLTGKAVPSETWDGLVGVPHPAGLPYLELHGEGGSFPPRGLADREIPRLRLAADGSFDFAELPSGHWNLVLVDAPGGALGPQTFFPCGSVDLVDGVTTRRDLDLAEALAQLAHEEKLRRTPVPTGHVQITLRDAQDRPVADVGLQFEVDGHRYYAAPTDAEGHATCAVAPGAARILVLPKAMTTREALKRMMDEARKSDGGDWFGPHLLPVGTCTVTADRTIEVTLRLPKDAGY